MKVGLLFVIFNLYLGSSVSVVGTYRNQVYLVRLFDSAYITTPTFSISKARYFARSNDWLFSSRNSGTTVAP
jgi:hypothetical protein